MTILTDGGMMVQIDYDVSYTDNNVSLIFVNGDSLKVSAYISKLQVNLMLLFKEQLSKTHLSLFVVCEKLKLDLFIRDWNHL